MSCDNVIEFPNRKTPVSNPGSIAELNPKHSLSNDLEVGLDYFRGTIYLADRSAIEHLIKALMNLMDDEPVWEYNQGSYMGKQWTHRGHSVKGAKWWFCDNGEGTQKAHLCLSLSGKIVSQIDIRKFWEFCRDVLLPLGFKVTRLDIAIDDYQKRINEGDVRKAAEVGNFGLVQKVSPYKTHKSDGRIEGFTWYFGSMKSDKFARFYDKDTESKGEIPSYRLEGQFMDETAHLVWLRWLAVDKGSFREISPQYLSGSVLGIIEFADRYSGKGGKRRDLYLCDRLPWWQKFIDDCGAHIRHSVPRAEATFEKAVRWIEKQVMARLAQVREVMGLLGFRGWLEEGLAREKAQFDRKQAAEVFQWSKGKSDVQQQMGGGAMRIDKFGNPCLWVYIENKACPAMSDWYTATFINTQGNFIRLRLMGQKAHSMPRRMCHFGDTKPTWVPGAIAQKVKDWAVNADIVHMSHVCNPE